jgi:hypothetical protein
MSVESSVVISGPAVGLPESEAPAERRAGIAQGKRTALLLTGMCHAG